MPFEATACSPDAMLLKPEEAQKSVQAAGQLFDSKAAVRGLVGRHLRPSGYFARYRITSYNVCYTKLLRSSAEITCPTASRPVAFRKFAEFSPNSWARLVIRRAKASSDPEMFSASVMQASLPDMMMMPWSSSSTVGVSPGASPMVEVPEGKPPLRHAFSLTVNLSLMESSPRRTISNTV